MEHVTSYLDQLRFDKLLAETFHGKYLRSIRIVVLLIFTVLLVGISSYYGLPKRLNPEIKIPIVTITTLLPGAGPSDIESQVTEPIEDSLSSVTGVDTVSSVSQDNVSSVVIQFISGTDKNKAVTDVQTAVAGASALPTEAKTPVVKAIDFEDQPVWTFTLSGSVDPASLNHFSQTLKDRIKDLSLVDRVVLRGAETEEIQILLNQNTIRNLGLDISSISRTVSTAVSSYPAGTVSSGNSNFSLAIDPMVTTIDDIRRLTISSGGKVVRLSEIATIWERPKPEQVETAISRNGEPARNAVTFAVYKTKTADIDKAADQVQGLVDTIMKEKNGQFRVDTVMNTGDRIKLQFSDLTHEFISTIILLFITLLLFLGIRQAVVVSFTVPLTFLWTFAVMRMAGLTLNFLSLFSLILSLGMLVDDAVVVVTAMTAYYRTGKFTPYETALLVWRDFIIPIWTTTITTVWAFIPLLLSTGIIGEFIRTIPIVVSSSLLTSTAIAVLITLPLMMVILKPDIPRRVKLLTRIVVTLLIVAGIYHFIPDSPMAPVILLLFGAYLLITHNSQSQIPRQIYERVTKVIPQTYLEKINSWITHGVIDIPTLAVLYERGITRVLTGKTSKRTVIVTVLIFTLFSYALVPLGLVVNEFFPKTDEEIIYASLELPSGATVAQSNAQARLLLPQLSQIKGVSFVVADTGASPPDDGGGAGQQSTNQVLFSLILPKKADQKRASREIAAELRSTFHDTATGKFSVIEISGGPPAGSDIQIKLSGDDLTQLDEYANKVMDYLNSQKGVTNVQKSIKGGVSKLVFIPDPTRLAQYNVTVDTIGGQLRTFGSGSTADTIKVNGEKQDITVRTDQGIHPVSDMGTIMIRTQTGSVPLTSLGTLQLKANPTRITRENGKRTLSVTAGVISGFSVSTINKNLEQYAPSLQLPTGYSWSTGGVNEENQKSVQSILQAMILAAVLIMATMVVQFNSFRKALIVLFVIPLAISGVFVMFALTGTPLSFPALIGILALFGIVVNNSMMIVDKITANQKTGMRLIPSIADACASRVEPILLTKLLTVIGLLPITLSDPLWRGLGGAIVSGILFASSIMLFFIPTVYYLWYRGEELPLATEPVKRQRGRPRKNEGSRF